MPNLPSGTVTFLFSDIEGSTALLKQLGDEAYAELLAQHRRLVRDALATHQGEEIDTQGDAFFYSFARARQAVAAAVEVQRAHAAATWPNGVSVRMRIGLHTGEPAVGEEGYTGLDVVRAARIAAVGQGGQVLLSEATRALVGGDLPAGVTLHALGEQRLKDIDRPEPLHELTIDGVSTSTAALAPARAHHPTPTPGAHHPTPTPDADAGPIMPPGLTDAVRHMPDWVRSVAAPFAPTADRAREAIEGRVLAEIQRALDEDEDLKRAPPPALAPPASPGSSVADEVARLRELRDGGALTEEQYARAVDRVVGGT